MFKGQKQANPIVTRGWQHPPTSTLRTHVGICRNIYSDDMRPLRHPISESVATPAAPWPCRMTCDPATRLFCVFYSSQSILICSICCDFRLTGLKWFVTATPTSRFVFFIYCGLQPLLRFSSNLTYHFTTMFGPRHTCRSHTRH